MGAICAAVPKALLPLVDARGSRVAPIIWHILKSAAQAGVTDAGLVVSPWQEKILQRYIGAVISAGHNEVPDRIELIVQEHPQGFGDAVLRGREFVSDEPFMLLLGDHVYSDDERGVPTTLQVVRAFARSSAVAMIGVQVVASEQLAEVGVARGKLLANSVYRCMHFVEKPDLATARRRLVTDDLDAGTFLAHCGIYIFKPHIFECLRELSCEDRSTEIEIELAAAQSMLLHRYPEEYYLYCVKGRAYDIGVPEGYARALGYFMGR